jgi:hypothetical protein
MGKVQKLNNSKFLIKPHQNPLELNYTKIPPLFEDSWPRLQATWKT